MSKCRNCSGTLRNGETSCFICGSPVPPEKRQVTFRDRFRTGVKIGFFFCGGLTIASLFSDMGPSFVKSLVATLILMLVKSSADQMAETQ